MITGPEHEYVYLRGIIEKVIELQKQENNEKNKNNIK